MQFNKISLEFLTDNYSKVVYSLPLPTYRKIMTKSKHQGFVVVTYELVHNVTSKDQFKWLTNIKQSMKRHIATDFKFVEYIESQNQDKSNYKYTFVELQEHFKAIKTIYPKIYLPSNKKEVYQRLCIYASKLYYHKMLYLEMIIYAAIMMNNLLGNPFKYKELLNKSKRAFDLIRKTELKQKLTTVELKVALRNGGIKRGEQKKIEHSSNKIKIERLVKSSYYLKPNGKPHITKIAKELELSRVTVSNILKKILLCLFPLFFFSFIILDSYIDINTEVYHNTIANFTLLLDKPFVEGL